MFYEQSGSEETNHFAVLLRMRISIDGDVSIVFDLLYVYRRRVMFDQEVRYPRLQEE